MSPVTIASAMLVCVFGCALFGLFLRGALPEHHLTAESRDVMKLTLGLVATMAALVLGLLTASAKSSYDIENAAVMESAANVILLDRTLLHYGAETKDIRAGLRQAIAFRLALTWPEDGKQGQLDAAAGTPVTEHLEESIRALSPATDAQRELRAKALQISDALLAARWMVFTRARNSIPTMFLLVLVFWIGILFGGFGLLAPRNATVVAIFAFCAVAVSGSILLILEMNQPFAGPMKISSAPLRYALEHIGR